MRTKRTKTDDSDLLRVGIDDDLAAEFRKRSSGGRGEVSRMVNQAIRERLEQLRWIKPLLSPEGHDGNDGNS